MATQITYERLYHGALEAATSIEACNADTPAANNAWLRGYLDAHCVLLAMVSDQSAAEWRTTLQRLATAKFTETMQRLEAL
jgi:hypothetical protein